MNPFARHPLRRYAFSWQQLAHRRGRHIDIGCGTGEFLGVLQATTAMECHGADPHPGYLEEVRRRHPGIPLRQLATTGHVNAASGVYDSASLLDVLEHVPDEACLLEEVHRLLKPSGLLVVTVPRQHVFSFLDPDNAKFRFPRFHRLVYSARFGQDVYRQRFVDLSDDLRGDMSVGKNWHTNYRRDHLVALLHRHRFEPVVVDGANLFWRWLQIPSLLGGRFLRTPLDRAMYLDGVLFKSANLYVAARRMP